MRTVSGRMPKALPLVEIVPELVTSTLPPRDWARMPLPPEPFVVIGLVEPILMLPLPEVARIPVPFPPKVVMPGPV